MRKKKKQGGGGENRFKKKADSQSGREELVQFSTNFFRKFLECVPASAKSNLNRLVCDIQHFIHFVVVGGGGGGEQQQQTILQKSGMSFCVGTKRGQETEKLSQSEYIPHDLSYLCSVGRRDKANAW